MDENDECNSRKFQCPGYDDGHWCHLFDLGEVGNDQASAVRCTCPVEFLSIEYDIPRADWIKNVDENASPVKLTQVSVENDCNPAEMASCSDQQIEFNESFEKEAEHNWSVGFSEGVTITSEASIDFGEVGFSAGVSVSYSFEANQSAGWSDSTAQTIQTDVPCVAPPMTTVTCDVFAYEATIEVGYTLYWKNMAPTRGIYKAKGHIVRMIAI